MNFFNFFKSKEAGKEIITSIGKFKLDKSQDDLIYTGIFSSKLGDKVEIVFPVINNEISLYQIEYYKNIENNYNFIVQQIKEINPLIRPEHYQVQTIMIPDKNHDSYDIEAEMVLQNKTDIISIILSDLKVEAIVKI